MNDTKKSMVYGLSVPSNARTIDEATTLKSGENHIRAMAGEGAYTITLPPLLECAGEVFVIQCIEGSAAITVARDTGPIYLANADADAAVLTDFADVMEDAGDILIVQNVNGVCWLVLFDHSNHA